MNSLQLSCRWSMTGRAEIDPRLFEVLEGIRSTRSLAGGARVSKVSYRHAWDLIGKWSERLGTPLAEMTRGSGSRLTPFAEKLLWAERIARERMEPQLRSLSDELCGELDRVRGEVPSLLSAFASHDLALGELRDHMNASGRVKLDVRFAGSLDALSSLARGACELAGFHVPRLASESIAVQYARALRRHHWRFVHFVTRQQGLIVAQGNPKRISGLASLTRRDVRFINRQVGSGTRLLLDALLTENGLKRERIAGYEVEEFTHAAVAATVASGVADAGFGIEAVVRRMGLAFVPLISEDYYLALRSAGVHERAIDALLRVLRGPRFRATISALPGYDAARCGEAVSLASILATLQEPDATPLTPVARAQLPSALPVPGRARHARRAKGRAARGG